MIIVWQNFAAVSWQEQITFQRDDDGVYKINTLCLMLIVLAHWNYSPRVDISLHFGYIILIPSQQTGQCSYFMSDDVRLVLCYVRVTRSLVFSLMFCRSLFDLLSFSFGHCVVCSSLVYRFWLPIWYLQSLL